MLGHRRFFMGFAALALCCLASSAHADDGPSFQHKNDPENLKALFETIHRTLHADKNPARARQLFQSLVPDDARLKAALRDDIGADSLKTLVELHQKLRKSLASKKFDPQKIVPSANSVVKVYAATTEEMVRYEKSSFEDRKNSPLYSQFPNGALRAAEQALRPGMTFYVVEFVNPDRADRRTKYDLFYWDGQQWSMLFEVYEILPRTAFD